MQKPQDVKSLPQMMQTDPPESPKTTSRTFFTEFARIGLSGFGGVLPVIRYSVVERNKWLNDREFVQLLSLAQALPGPNVINLSLMLGYRFGGIKAAFSAFAGLIFPPIFVLLAFFSLYQHYQNIPMIKQILLGMSAAAAGLILATGIKFALTQERTWRVIVLGCLSFLCVGLLRLPLLKVLLFLVPVALVSEWYVHFYRKPRDKA